MDTPLGRIEIAANERALTRITWVEETGPACGAAPEHPILRAALQQLREYFAGTRRSFDLPLAPEGGALQQAVCQAMLESPFGQTRSYGEIAKALGVAAQPIGQACGGNSIPIVIPCHRVLAADGRTGGFSGGTGVETKLALLRHEGALLL
jgi:methylated-DNA-[protein]-cysteine S-methyltransferase